MPCSTYSYFLFLSPQFTVLYDKTKLDMVTGVTWNADGIMFVRCQYRNAAIHLADHSL